MIVGILLAAGLGSRFGGDKLLHLIPSQNTAQINADNSTPSNGEPSIAMGLQSALNLAPHVNEVICVVRPEDKTLTALFTQHGFKVCVSEDYTSGLSASLMAGIRGNLKAQAWWIALGDMPFIKAASYQALHHQLQQQLPKATEFQQIIRPHTRSNSTFKPGHPVIFPQRLKSQLLNLSGDEGAKVILKTENQNVLKVLVDDMGIHKDVDEKSDLN